MLLYYTVSRFRRMVTSVEMCELCHNQNVILVERYRRVQLFGFIPFITTKYYATCYGCGGVWEISKSNGKIIEKTYGVH